jgi:mannose-6-phosphate isomerase-like protein (cupin superfamily)
LEIINVLDKYDNRWTPPASLARPLWSAAAGDYRSRHEGNELAFVAVVSFGTLCSRRLTIARRIVMAYIFKEDELPSLVSVVPGRERIFFVNRELANIDDMLAGVMHYKKGAASPLHLHKNCEHFYFIISGKATVESDEGVRPVGPGDMIFIPAEEKHRLRATEPLFYFEFQAPNRFKTTILEGTEDDLRWERKDGRIWVQT